MPAAIKKPKRSAAIKKPKPKYEGLRSSDRRLNTMTRAAAVQVSRGRQLPEKVMRRAADIAGTLAFHERRGTAPKQTEELRKELDQMLIPHGLDAKTFKGALNIQRLKMRRELEKRKPA